MKAVFTIAGEPMGKGRPQFSTYGGRITARTPQRTVAYENLVTMEYKAQAGCGMSTNLRSAHVFRLVAQSSSS